MIRPVRAIAFTAVAAAAVLTSRSAFAGPPLLCEPFAIGTARSLPMGHGGWQTIDPKYDVSHLVDDTLAAFDYGYFVEALREAEAVFKVTSDTTKRD